MKKSIVLDWNETETGQTIPERFDKIVTHFGSNIAVIDQQHSYTFNEIDRLSRKIAFHLDGSGVPAKSPVAVLFGPSVSRIAGILGILRSGRPFVPMDITYPVERNKLILDDSGATVLITDNYCKSEGLQITRDEMLLINADRLPDTRINSYIPVHTFPDDLCTIIYTSGSSGKPKGVMHTHKSVRIEAMNTSLTLGLNTEDRFLQVSPTGSVASLSQTMSAVLSGSVSLPFSLRLQGLHSLGLWIKQHHVSIFSAAPTIFRHLCMEFPQEKTFDGLRIIRLGGEQVYGNDLKLCRNHCGENTILQVAYGSTETGINTVKNYLPGIRIESRTNILSIGSPVHGKEFRILNDQMVEVPEGETGELHIACPGLAQGYFGQPGLTAEKFIDLASANGKRKRFYRTGDLVRAIRDGELEFAGRKDNQLKIHGFRTEPAEIEAAIITHQKVKECAVEMKAQVNHQHLVAYLSLHKNQQVTENDLRTFLQEMLPLHMIPKHFVFLDKLPVNPNGKIDRDALHGPQTSQANVCYDKPYPKNSSAVLLDIWKALLKREDLQPGDNFFQSGGDSLLMLKMVEEIRRRLHHDIEIATIIQNPTLLAIEKKLKRKSGHSEQLYKAKVVTLGAINDEAPLIFVGIGAYVHHIAEEMKQSRPVYAFDLSRHIELIAWDGNIDGLTIKHMAQVYTNLILKNISEKNIILAGHSFYGVLAFEVAHQLMAFGKKIYNVVLFDTYLKMVYPPLLTRVYRLMQQNNMAPLQNEQPAQDDKDVISMLNHLSENKEVVAWSDFEPYAQLIRKQAIKNYVPKPLPCKGLLLRAKALNTERIHNLNIDYGWRSYFKGGLEIAETDGEHLSIVQVPNIGVLAKKLNYLLTVK
nr:AMP-binding protein [Bacteroidota bacterium]